MSLSEKMITTINEVDMDKIIDFIDKNIKDDYISNHNSTLQGWHQDFLLDEDGNLCLTGHLSTGSMCMSTYEGTSIVLDYIPSYFEMGDWFTSEDIANSLNKDEKKNCSKNA